MAKAAKKPTTKKKVRQTPVYQFPEWPLNVKQTFWAFFGCIVLITLTIYSPYLFGDKLFLFTDVGSDTLTMFYPNLVEAARYFQETGIPAWSFYTGLGANNYPGFLNSPLQWPYLMMDAVTIAHSIAWVQAAVMIGVGLVFYKFMRVAEFSLPVSFIGAFIYTFGGYLVIGSTWYGHSHVILWMTLAILGFELLLRKKMWWVFPIPFIMLLGARGYFLVLFIAFYGTIRMIDFYGWNWKALLGGYKRLAICGIIALLFSIPFIGGEWHRFRYSPRVSGDVSYSDELAERSVLHTSNQEHMLTAFFRMISNDGVGAGDDFKGWKNYLEAPAFYMGLITILLVLQFFALATPRRRLLYGILLGVWVFLIIFPWFRFAFYGFAGNYYKGALSLFIPFSFLFVGMLGLQDIVTRRKVNLPVLVISFLAILSLMWIPYDEPEIKVSQAVNTRASLFLVAYLFILGAMWAGAGKKIMLVLLALVIMAEAAVFSWPALNERGSITKADIRNKKYHFDDSIEAAQFIRDTDKELFYRTDKMYGSVKSGFNDGMVQGYFGSKMYQSHNHKNYVRFMTEMELIDGTLEANTRWLLGVAFVQLLHPLFSIKYVMSNEASHDKVDKVIYKEIHQVGNVKVYQNNYYIPFGIPFDQVIDYDDFMKLDRRNKRLALYEGIVLEDAVAANNASIAKWDTSHIPNMGPEVNDILEVLPSKAMKMEFFNHKRIRGSIEVSRPSMIFFSIPFDIGWKARVGGADRELQQVHIGFTGLYVDPGKHEIELHYEPPLSKTGWLGILAGFLAGFLVYRFRDRFWA